MRLHRAARLVTAETQTIFGQHASKCPLGLCKRALILKDERRLARLD
jgi:hypothetical protein